MYDLYGLEKKWIGYKRVRYRRFFLLSAAFVAVAVVSAFLSYLVFTQSAPKGETKVEANASTTQKSESQSGGVAELKLEKTSEPQREIVIISPNQSSGGFVNPQPVAPLSFEGPSNSQRQILLQQPPQLSRPQLSQSLQPQSQPSQWQQPQPQPTPPIQQVQPRSQPKISIETKPADTIAILEDRYKKNENIDTALLLCDEYYRRGEYKKALSWAIKANSLDARNERSWILFAKSSAKLGRKDDAINALESYLKTNNSDSVRAVLEQIKSGEM